MNASARLCQLFVLSILFLLAACATSPLSRIDSNRALYESWPLEVQEAVLNGQVKQGMTPEMVQMSVGKPTQVINRSVQAGDDEIWIYRKGGGGSSILRNTGVSIGGGVGGVGVSTGTTMGGGGAVEEEHEVVFQKGVVVRTDF